MVKNKFIIVACFLFLFGFTKEAFAGGVIANDDLTYYMANVLDFIFVCSMFLSIVSVFLVIIGNITGKFKVKTFIPFIFLIIAICSQVLFFNLNYFMD